MIEVLVAFFILAVGIVGVISLFPIGVQQVRQAVQDTRSTIMAINAESTLEMHDWPNDPFLLAPQANPSNWVFPAVAGALVHPMDPSAPAIGQGNSGQGNSVYARMIAPDGTGEAPWQPPPATPVGPGYPILVDPVLANAADFQSGIAYKRVLIQDRAGILTPMPGTIAEFQAPQGYLDLPVYTLSDIQLLPDNAFGINFGRRGAALRQWFYSDADVHWEKQNGVIPRNPNRQLDQKIGLQPWEYYQSTLPPTLNPTPTGNAGDQARATAERDSLYSWAFVIIGRPLSLFTPSPPGSPFVDVIPKSNWRSNVRILIFQRRNLADPYRLCRGCFFNGSNVATLSWPVASALKETQRPSIRRGTWLMEYTNTGPNRTDTSAAGRPISRQSITFHRVAAFDDPVVDSGGANVLQTVTLERPVSDPGFATHQLGNLRALPDGFATPKPAPAGTPLGPVYFGVPPGPTAAVTAAVGVATPAQNAHVWVPVIIWDGLIEAFEVKD